MVAAVDVRPEAGTEAEPLRAGSLGAALLAVAPFAGTDNTFPALCAVQVQDDGAGSVTLRATDRYVAARVILSGSLGFSGSVLLPLKAAVELGKSLADRRGYPMGPVSVTRGPAAGAVVVSWAFGDCARTVREVDASFPALDRLIVGAQGRTDDGAAAVVLNPEMVAPFAKAMKAFGVKATRGLRFTVGKDGVGAMVATFGKNVLPEGVDFVGMLMPMRWR